MMQFQHFPMGRPDGFNLGALHSSHLRQQLHQAIHNQFSMGSSGSTGLAVKRGEWCKKQWNSGDQGEAGKETLHLKAAEAANWETGNEANWWPGHASCCLSSSAISCYRRCSQGDCEPGKRDWDAEGRSFVEPRIDQIKDCWEALNLEVDSVLLKSGSLY